MQIKISLINKIRYGSLAFLLLLFLFSFQIITAPKASATTYNVTPSSACSFQEALEAAATDAPVGSCAAGDGDDTVNVGAGTYTSTGSLGYIVNPGNISVIGENATTTIIDGAGFSGVVVAATGNYLIENLTFQNFNPTDPGAALINNAGGNVTLNKLIIKNNTCVGVTPVCAIAVTLSAAGINTTISNSVFTENTAFFLIGNIRVINEGPSGNATMNVFNNTIYNNNSSIMVIQNSADAEGQSTANFYNNTVVNNKYYAEFVNEPFIMNLGSDPAYFSASLNLRNNIFSSNKRTDGTTPGNCVTSIGENATLTSDGGNISNDTTCNTLFTATNDKNSTDPLLGAYQQVGSTFVLPLQAGSPALENAVSGAPTTPTVDQRGVARPQGSASDSGAYEYVYPTPGLPSTGGILASTGFDMRLLTVIAGLLVFAGIGAASYSLRKR